MLAKLGSLLVAYTRWIHHGEPLEVVLHENEDHVDEHASLSMRILE
jgi:hypothetical protein